MSQGLKFLISVEVFLLISTFIGGIVAENLNLPAMYLISTVLVLFIAYMFFRTVVVFFRSWEADDDEESSE